MTIHLHLIRVLKHCTRLHLLMLALFTLSGCLSDQDISGLLHDQDGDGIRSCSASTDVESCDCDDQDALIHPGADEVCDGKDNNCDGALDEGFIPFIWYPDQDADGFGTLDVNGDGLSDARSLCWPRAGKEQESHPHGFSANDDDCNDQDDRYHPASDSETCSSVDGNDYNCDGVVGSVDHDGDGYPACGECDDTASDVWPGHAEVCDGKDNNCNGVADDDPVTTTFYLDQDGDGYGDSTKVKLEDVCSIDGYSTAGGDCNDGDPAIHPGAPELCNAEDDDCDFQVDEGVQYELRYEDKDKDGHGNPDAPLNADSDPCDGVPSSDDCDDTNPLIYPGATESCTESVDANCDGHTGDEDADHDAYPACDDCNDSDALIHPGAVEQCDLIDNDCDFQIDESSPIEVTFYRDADHDGYGTYDQTIIEKLCAWADSEYVSQAGDCNDLNPAIHEDGTEICNGQDDDCDEVIPAMESDSDADGVRSCDVPPDCDDADPNSSPLLIEWADGQDNNCDGQVDEGFIKTWYTDTDGDNFGDPENSTQAVEQPEGYVADNTDCNDTDAAVNPAAEEVCNHVDDNCDDLADEDLETQTYYPDGDLDGFGITSEEVSDCQQPTGFVTEGEDCEDQNAEINPGANEVCDDIDNNCVGGIDENVKTTWYPDQDSDGYGNSASGVLACTQPDETSSLGGDCNDRDDSIYPSAVELCDQKDNDCDDSTDEEVQTRYFADTDQDGYPSSSVTTYACSAPQGYLTEPPSGIFDCNDQVSTIYPGATELCNHADDDCDGAADEDLPLDTWYADNDGDGYGDLLAPQSDCKQPSNTVENTTDCDDDSDSVYPEAPELCNDEDDDCDGDADEGLPVDTWYGDTDGDGYGNPSAPQSDCTQPPNTADDNTDCNDDSASVHPEALELCNHADDNCNAQVDEGLLILTWYPDKDGDGFGAASPDTQDCRQPTGQVSSSSDCLDSDAQTFPGAAEKESSTACRTDKDLDGYGSSAPLAGVDVGTDCLDSDAQTFPGAAEKESSTACRTDKDTDGYGSDAPLAGVNAGRDCQDTDEDVNPVAVELCDGKDNDCDGVVDSAFVCSLCEVDDSFTTTDATHLKEIKDALKSSSICKDILVYPGEYIPFSVGKAGPLTIHSNGGAAQTTINVKGSGTGINFSNSSTLVIGNDVVVDGFTITGGTGQPDPAGTGALLGGGIYVGKGAAPTLKNLIVVSSSATNGGGIFIDGTCTTCTQSPVLHDLTVGGSPGKGNTAVMSGGGIELRNIPWARPLTVTGAFLRVEGNQVPSGSSTAPAGGGLYAYSAALKLIGTELQVIGNYAYWIAGGVGLVGSSLDMDATASGLIESNYTSYYDAGGMAIWDSSTVNLHDVTFDKNTSGRHGGAIHQDRSLPMTLSDCTFTGNGTWSAGGAINAQADGLTVNNSSFSGNYATNESGGAIHVTGGLTLTDTTFTSNTAKNSADGSGGAVYAGQSVTLTDTTFSSNTASSSGGAVYAGGDISLVTDTVIQANVAGGSGGALYAGGKISAVNIQLILLDNKANGGVGGAVYAGGSFVGSRVLVGNNLATSSGANPTCAGIRMNGGSITQAIFWNNKAVNGTGGILCLDGTGGNVDSVIFSGNQVSGGATLGASMVVTGSNHVLKNLTFAYSEGLSKKSDIADVYNTSTTLTLQNTIGVAVESNYLDYFINSNASGSALNLSQNAYYHYGSDCGGNVSSCGTLVLPDFVFSTDDGDICDEDYHLSASNPQGILTYGAFGLDSTWDESMPLIPECSTP